MRKQSILVTAVILGIAVVPFGVQNDEVFFNRAEAQDSSLTEKSTPAKVPEPNAKSTVNGVRQSVRLNPVISTGNFFDLDATIFGLQVPGQPLPVGPEQIIQVGPHKTISNTITLTAPLIGQEITSGGGISLEGMGQNFHIVLTGSTLTAGAESTQPDLSRQYLKLSKQLAKLKVKQMPAQRLAVEVETLKKEIANQEAILKLEEAQEQLKKILNDHPESPAAQSARRMLETGTNAPAVSGGVNALPTY